jgi:hypothetical protein
MADPARHRADYLWVDPPWELLREGVLAVSAADYPDPADAQYRELHEAWGEQVRPLLDRAVLTGVEHRTNGVTEFSFDGGVTLRAQASGAERDETLWYDDWYATT